MEFESIDKEPDNMEPSTIPKQFEWRGSGRGPSRVTPPDISLHNVDGPLYTVHVLRVGHNPQNFNSKHTYPAPYAHHQVADGVTRAKLERSMSVREPVKCTITLITGRDIGPILVDPGDTWDRAWLLQELHALHIDPLNVQYVIGTHGHADHIGNLNLFPNAIQIVGFDINVPPYGEWVRHDWREQIPYDISSFIEVVPTPGHTSEDLTVVVRRARLLCSSSPNSCESPHSGPTPLLLSRGAGGGSGGQAAAMAATAGAIGEGDGVGVAVAGDTFECEADVGESLLWQSLSANRELQSMYRQAILADEDIEFIVPGHGAPFRVQPAHRQQPVVDLAP